MKGKIKTNRVAIHVSGASKDKVLKLLGIPEVMSGTGEAEAKKVMEVLGSWNIQGSDCVIGVQHSSHQL